MPTDVGDAISSPLSHRIIQAGSDLNALLSALANTSRALTSFSETLAKVTLPDVIVLSDSDEGDLSADDESDARSEGASYASSESAATSVSDESGDISCTLPAKLEEFKIALGLTGTYYVVLDEDFDALPLIALYASNCSRTCCYSATTESLNLWKNILSNIVHDCDVVAPATKYSVKRLGEKVPQLLSGSQRFTLHLAFKTLTLRKFQYSGLDCLLFWGLPSMEYTSKHIVSDTHQVPHTCIILTREEFDRPGTQEKLDLLGAINHPSSKIINAFEPNSLLSDFRTLVEKELVKTSNHDLIQISYLGCATYYNVGGGRHNGWSPPEVLRQANLFASRVLRRGSGEDEGSRFKPLSIALRLKSKILRSLGLDGVDLAKASHEAAKLPTTGSSQPSVNTNALARNSSTKSAKHTYLVLEEEFDIIPLINYFADTHGKVICFISHTTKIAPFKRVFIDLSPRIIICPGRHDSSIGSRIDEFRNSDSAVLFLKGDEPSRNRLRSVLADLVICWGLSSEVNYLTHINYPRATQTCLLLTKDEEVILTNGFVSKHKLQKHPDSSQLVAYGPKSPLLPYRTNIKAALPKANPEYLKEIYISKLSIPSNTVLETARRANKFLARVLLHGDPEDGSEAYKPVGPRLKIARKAVTRGGLEQAVERGLIVC